MGAPGSVWLRMERKKSCFVSVRVLQITLVRLFPLIYIEIYVPSLYAAWIIYNNTVVELIFPSLKGCIYLMLNKPLNIAHAKDRQAQRCIKKGLFDSAVNLERNIIENLEVFIDCLLI